MARSILVIVLVGGLIAGAAYWASTKEEAMHQGSTAASVPENLKLVPVNALTLSRVGEPELNYCPVVKKESKPAVPYRDSMQTVIDGKPVYLCCGNCEPMLPPATEKILKGESCVDTRIQT